MCNTDNFPDKVVRSYFGIDIPKRPQNTKISENALTHADCIEELGSTGPKSRLEALKIARTQMG